MTLSTLTSRVSYPGAGSVGPFAFPFRILDSDDLLVTRTSGAGVETTLVEGVDYTVAGVGAASGSVTLTVALAVNELLVLRRAPALVQPISIRNQGAYFPATIEDQFDRVAMQLQWLQDQINEGPLYPTFGLGGGSITTNLAGGFQALFANTSGDHNAAFGYQSMVANTTGNQNAAFGSRSLQGNTTGYANAAFGFESMPVNTTGYANTALGCTALLRLVSGNNNTAAGVDTLQFVTASYSNSAFGSNALGFGDGGHSNTAAGWRAAWNSGGGIGNAAFGLEALNDNLTGDFNTAMGPGALFKTLGDYSTGVGVNAGLNALGSRNLFLGAFAGQYETGSNAFYVDNQDRTNTAGDKSKALMWGVFDANPANQTLAINAALTLNGTGIIRFGSKAGSSQTLLIGTAEATNQMTLAFSHSTNVSYDIQAIEQGLAFPTLRLNPTAGEVHLASAGVDTKTLGRLLTVASAAVNGSGLRVPHGTAPTAPVNGDIWTTTAGLFVRINGATVGPLS